MTQLNTSHRLSDNCFYPGHITRASRRHYASGWRTAIRQAIGHVLVLDLIEMIVSYVDLRRIVFVALQDDGDESSVHYIVSIHPRDDTCLYIHVQFNDSDYLVPIVMYGLLHINQYLWLPAAENHRDCRTLVPLFQVGQTKAATYNRLIVDPRNDPHPLPIGCESYHQIDRCLYGVNRRFRAIHQWQMCTDVENKTVQFVKRPSISIPSDYLFPGDAVSINTQVYQNRYLCLVYTVEDRQWLACALYDTHVEQWLPKPFFYTKVSKRPHQLQSIVVESVHALVCCSMLGHENQDAYVYDNKNSFSIVQVQLDKLVATLLNGPQLTGDDVVRQIQSHPAIPCSFDATFALAAMDDLLYVFEARPIIKPNETVEEKWRRQMHLPARVHEYNLHTCQWTTLSDSVLRLPLKQDHSLYSNNDAVKRKRMTQRWKPRQFAATCTNTVTLSFQD